MAEALSSKLSPRQDAMILEKLDEMQKLGVAPGFQLCLGFKDQCLGLYVLGKVRPDRSWPVSPQTHFDLASLTKVISIFSLVTLALQSRRLESLHQNLGDFFPSLPLPLRDRNILDLLEHRSGLPATFEDIREDLSGREAQLRHFLSSLERMEISSAPETLYSDVGFMLLGFLLEGLYGQPLRSIFATQLGDRFGIQYGPLKMPWTILHWLFESDFVAPTQSLEDPSVWLRGEAQDSKCRWLNGDAGHAGLFATAQSVEDWGRELYLGYHGKARLFSDRILRELLDRPSEGRFISGWDQPTQPSQAGKTAAERMIGHLGYTGTSFWMDLEKGIRVTLLCHRHGPGRDETLLSQQRPILHDWLYQEIFSEVSKWN